MPHFIYIIACPSHIYLSTILSERILLCPEPKLTSMTKIQRDYHPFPITIQYMLTNNKKTFNRKKFERIVCSTVNVNIIQRGEPLTLNAHNTNLTSFQHQILIYPTIHIIYQLLDTLAQAFNRSKMESYPRRKSKHRCTNLARSD